MFYQTSPQGSEFFKVGRNQLLDWALDGRISDNRDTSEKYDYTGYVIAHVAVSFGRVHYLSIIDGCKSYEKACELAQSYQDASLYLALTHGHRMVDEYQVWQPVDDESLWGDWERKVSASRLSSKLPMCFACGDDCGPWVRVSTIGGGWGYLCESCFDNFNRINTFIGRHRVECL